jgi:opacity protein-like surface antigen
MSFVSAVSLTTRRDDHTMRHLGLRIVFVALTSATASPLSAQALAAKGGTIAVGGRIGPALPRDDSGLQRALALVGTVDGYLTPRVLLKGEVGTFSLNAERRGYFNPVRSVFVNLNVAYQWEHGSWRPYATAGLGIYHFSLDAGPVSHGPSNRGDNDIGASFGGGLEYFLSRRVTLIADLRYHSVGDVVAIIPFKGSFVSPSIGAKRYF